MADAVNTIVIANTPHDYVVHLTNLSDGTGESGVVKVDKSTLTDSSSTPVEPDSLDLRKVRWNVQGFTYVKLAWDHTTDDTMMLLTGSGYEDFTGVNDGLIGKANTAGLPDPRSAGDTGDVKLTTAGTTSGNTYDITLWFRKAAV